MRRVTRLFAPLTALLLVVGACSPAGSDAIEITARFPDAQALTVDHHVRAGDVPIGTVTDISLDDEMQAVVTMRIRPDTGLPARTEAVLGRTSLLGEMFIDLRPVDEGGELQAGAVLEDTRTITEFEQLVATGDNGMSIVASEQLNAAIETGAVAFGGRGDLIGRFIEDVESFVGSYNDGSDDLLRLIDTLDGFAAALAPDAEVNAEALRVLREASEVLEEEDDRLIDALADLDELAETGGRILEDHREEIDDAIRRLRIVLEQVTRVEGALEGVLLWLPRHNLHVPNGVVLEQGSGRHFAQVWLDFIVCGLQDTPGDPSRDCTPDNPNQRAPDPGPQVRSDECYDDLAVCREETDRDLGRRP